MFAGVVARWALAAVSLVAPALAAEERESGVGSWMASTVCIVGDVKGGSFESSGFVVGNGEQVVTTAHGIGAAANLRVKLSDGRVFPARLEHLGDESADVALLAVGGGARLAPAALGSVEGLAAGAELVAIGCPLGFEFSVTRGVVSSIRPSELGYPLIQIDVPVNPGSSGSPLFDRRGQVVGIVKGAAAGRERVHFALPIDLGKAVLDAVTHERRAYELFNEAVLEPKPDEKVSLYRKAIAEDADLFEAHFNLALALERQGRVAEADAEYRETLRLRPAHAAASLNLGAALYGEKRFAEAVAVYRKALARDPRSVGLRNNLAETYRAMGDKAAARREFESLLRDSPDYAPAHYGLGLLLDAEPRDQKLAAEHYRRYLELAPEASDREQVREWLERAERAKPAPR